MKECFSGSIGCVVMDGNVDSCRRVLIHWLREFGLSSSSTSIVLTTDSEEAVGAFVSGGTPGFHFLVQRAGPQVHEAVGHVERCVRSIKEGIAVTREELRENGLDYQISHESLKDLCRYVCHMHNQFSRAHGSSKSPKEIAVGRDLNTTHVSAFLSQVLVEIPEAVSQRFPHTSRFVDGFYLFPSWMSQSSDVIGKIISEGTLQFVRFIAKSIKVVLPLRWSVECHESLVHIVGGESEPQKEPRAVVPSSSLKCPPTGPPVEWLRRHGYMTKGRCNACDGLRSSGTRKAKTHSRACCKRYEEWLTTHASEHAGHDALPDEPMPHVAPDPNSSDVLGNEPKVHFKEPPEWPDEAPRKRQSKGPDPRDEYYRSKEGDVGSFEDMEREFGVPGKTSTGPRIEDYEDMEVESFTPSTGIKDVTDDRDEIDDVANLGDVEDIVPDSVKRSPEVSVEDLEKELDEERRVERRKLDALWGTPFVNLCQLCSEEPRVRLDDEYIESIRFQGNKDGEVESGFETLGGFKIRVWCPSDALDDSNGDVLNGKLAFEGMRAEVRHMHECEVGEIFTLTEWKLKSPKFAKEINSDIRIIPTRWVTVAKNEAVRSRLVIKDVASGDSARSLGISSPTPSSDAFMIFVAVTAHFDWRVASLDVAHAFMHTPRVLKDVAVKLPQSLTSSSGETLVLWLRKALNGLRSASLEWLLYLQSLVAPLGLQSERLEPCLFSGVMQSGGRAMLITYVDDVLYSTEFPSDMKKLEECISGKVPVKLTGKIGTSQEGGGRLLFIGREVFRKKGDHTIFVKVPSTYLDRTFEAYQLKMGSRSGAAPDLSVLEKEGEPLSAEAYSKFRSALGKIAWMSQTRQDLRIYIALLSTQQAAPTSSTEAALRSLLRFLMIDMEVSQMLPSACEEFGHRELAQPRIVAYTDASHAPFRSTKRKSISGGCLSFLGSTIKTYARHQQSVSLSACESEMTGIQTMCLESLVLARITSRILKSFKAKEYEVFSEVFTDSESSLKLLKGIDMPRRSRHIEIKIERVKEKISEKQIVVKYRRGTKLVADMLTKCLHTKEFKQHRETMGYVPSNPVMIDLVKNSQKPFAILEVCCGENSSINMACQHYPISYYGITEVMEEKKTFDAAKKWIASLPENVHIHVHVSTPCLVGSPLKHFSGHSADQEMQWCSIIQCASSYMSLGSTSSFELPKSNSIWGRWYVQKLLKKQGHDHHCFVHICMTGLLARTGLPIPKQLCFSSNSELFVRHLDVKFGKCTCVEHAKMNDIHWAVTASYAWKLGREILSAVEKIAGTSE